LINNASITNSDAELIEEATPNSKGNGFSLHQKTSRCSESTSLDIGVQKGAGGTAG
jgi:hypothetical protein